MLQQIADKAACMLRDYLATTTTPKTVVILVAPSGDPLSTRCAYGFASDAQIARTLERYLENGPGCADLQNVIAWGVLQALIVQACELLATFFDNTGSSVDTVLLVETGVGTVAATCGDGPDVQSMITVAIAQCRTRTDERIEEDE